MEQGFIDKKIVIIKFLYVSWTSNVRSPSNNDVTFKITIELVIDHY
jgi:hypothetical protein